MSPKPQKVTDDGKVTDKKSLPSPGLGQKSDRREEQKTNPKGDGVTAPSPNNNKNFPTITDICALSKAEINTSFYDQEGEAWALVKQTEEQPVLMRIESKEFADWVRVMIYEYKNRPVENWVMPLVKLLASEARRKKKRVLSLRFSENNNNWFIQESRHASIIITKAGKIDRGNTPSTFRHFDTQESNVFDLKAEKKDIELLTKYLPFRTVSDKELYLDILPAYFVPNIAKPGILSQGAPGSGKSMLGRITGMLIDPQRAHNEGVNLPKKDNDKELWTIGRRRHVVHFDNVSYISPKTQDDICKLVTGCYFSFRELYTNNDETGGYLRNIILINGISIKDLQSDFLDRFFSFEFDRIPEGSRISEEVFYDMFKEDKPKILGAIIKILAEARKRYSEERPESIMRLRDFEGWALRCAMARGRPREEHVSDLIKKLAEQNDNIGDNNPFAWPLVKFMNDKDEWSGTAQELLKALEEQEFGQIVGPQDNEKIIVNVKKWWPSNPAVLGRKLREIKDTFLRNQGITFEDGRQKKRREMVFRKMPSPRHPSAPNPGNQTLEGFSRVTDNSELAVTLPSPRHPETEEKELKVEEVDFK